MKINRRYQVFISSTYQDLILERNEVIKALLELDCIPCGMEYFPASNEDQWNYIKKIIEGCDYYIVITAGKYGSQDSQGISYTQKEYEYAIEKNIPVIGFIYKNLNKLSIEKSEVDLEIKRKLDYFHNLVKSKLCRFFETPEELGAVVSRSLTQEIKNNPRVGWIRADIPITEHAAEEILRLREQNAELQKELELALQKPLKSPNEFAQGSDIFEFSVDVSIFCRTQQSEEDEFDLGTFKVKLSWDEIFLNSTSDLLIEKKESNFKSYINHMPIVYEYLADTIKRESEKFKKEMEKSWPKIYRVLDDISYRINEIDFQTIKIQLIALGLLELFKEKDGKGSLISYIKLSPFGEKKFIHLRSVKKNV